MTAPDLAALCERLEKMAERWDDGDYADAPSAVVDILFAVAVIHDREAERDQARADAIEEAARIAETEEEPPGAMPDEMRRYPAEYIVCAAIRVTKRNIARDIRALAPAPTAETRHLTASEQRTMHKALRAGVRIFGPTSEAQAPAAEGEE